MATQHGWAGIQLLARSGAGAKLGAVGATRVAFLRFKLRLASKANRKKFMGSDSTFSGGDGLP